MGMVWSGTSMMCPWPRIQFCQPCTQKSKGFSQLVFSKHSYTARWSQTEFSETGTQI